MTDRRFAAIIGIALFLACFRFGGPTAASADFCTIGWQSDWPSFTNERYGAGGAVAEGKFFLFGGVDNAEPTYRSDCQVFDPDLATWSWCADLPFAKSDFGGAAIEGHFFSVGGINEGIVSTVFRYAVDADEWEIVSPYPIPIAGVMCAEHEWRLYCFGGTSDGLTAVTAAYVYDPAADQWTAVAPLPAGKVYGAAATLQGSIYLTGGWVQDSSTFAYDPQTDAYEIVDSPLGRNRPALIAAGGMLWLTAGGNGWQELPSGDENYFSAQWSDTGTQIARALVAPAAAYLPGYGVVLAGGCRSDEPDGSRTVQLWRTCVPTPEKIEPAAGSAATAVSISGQGFEADLQVYFTVAGGDLISLEQVTVLSATEATAQLPAAIPAGVYDLALVGSLGQQASLPGAFTVEDATDDDDDSGDDDDDDNDTSDDDTPDEDDDTQADDDDTSSPAQKSSAGADDDACGC